MKKTNKKSVTTKNTKKPSKKAPVVAKKVTKKPVKNPVVTKPAVISTPPKAPSPAPKVIPINNDINVELTALSPFLYQGTIPDVNIANGDSVTISFRISGLEVSRREYKLPDTIGGKVGGTVNLIVGFMTYLPITPTGKSEVEIIRYN